MNSHGSAQKIRTQPSQLCRKSAAKFANALNSSNDMIGEFFDNLEGEQLLTAEQLAGRLNIAVKTVRKWRYENVLPPDSMVKLRHQVRYRWDKIVRWLTTKKEK